MSSPCGIPGPDSAAAGAPRPAGAHTATQICRAGAEWSLQLQSVCSHCSHQSHARLMLVFCSAGFTILQRCSVAAGRRCLVCMQQLTAATPSCRSCSTVGTKTILTITTLLFIGRYVFHFAQATAVQFKSTKKIQYVQECVAVCCMISVCDCMTAGRGWAAAARPQLCSAAGCSELQ